MGFSRQEHWSKLPFPPPSSLPEPGIKPMSPVWQADSLPLSQLGNPPCKAGVPKGCWVLKTEILMGPRGWARRLPQPLEPPLPTTLWDLVTLAFHVLQCPVPLPTLGPFCIFSSLPRMPFPSLPSQLIFTHTSQERESSAHVFMRPPDWATSLRFTHTSNWSAVYFVGSQSTHTHKLVITNLRRSLLHCRIPFVPQAPGSQQRLTMSMFTEWTNKVVGRCCLL